MVLRFQSLEVERTRKMEGNRGRSPPYIERNPSTAFAARLIPQYESHIRVTKETIQFVVNLTKEIPHSNRVTKERTRKLSQHVSPQGTVRLRPLRPLHLSYLPPQKTPTCVPPLQRPNIWRLETYECQPAFKWVSRDPGDFILITFHIRF